MPTLENETEKVLAEIFKRFKDNSLEGESIKLVQTDVQGQKTENVVYEFIRDCLHPDYVGVYDDVITFGKEYLVDLIKKTLSSSPKEASIIALGIKEDCSNIENFYDGLRQSNFQYPQDELQKINLSLKIEKDNPILKVS